MEIRRKLELIELLLTGAEDELDARGFCDREQTEMRSYLIMHGYVSTVRRSNNGGSLQYVATAEGGRFLDSLRRRVAARSRA